MKSKQLAMLLVVTLIFLSTPCFSEPSRTAIYLLNEPVSVMDFGIYKLQANLQGMADNFSHDVNWKYSIGIFVGYYGSSNQIIIDTQFGIVKEFKDAKTAKASSLKTINNIRQHLGVNIETGQFSDSLKDATVNPIYRHFSHEGYIRGSQPEELAVSIGNMMRIKTKAVFHIPNSTNGTIICEGVLLGKEISCSE